MKIPKRFRAEIRLAKRIWGDVSRPLLQSLEVVLRCHRLSVLRGDLLLLNHRWYVTHTGLLRIAARHHCHGIQVTPATEFCDIAHSRFAFRATVYTAPACRGFMGYGDAEPCNVSPLLRGAEMRIAETRAVNRALRKAYGIGICSVEELGSYAETPRNSGLPTDVPAQCVNGNTSAGPKVRDRLCQIIRQHQLDPELVKAYAVDFCGAKTLREATREQLENFTQELAEWAVKDRNALLCQLNSYMRPAKEVVA
jgi:hypothetical protein